MPTAAIPGGLADFQKQLIGTWSNEALPNTNNGEGGPSKAFSYDIMPLPQQSAAGGVDGFILKNSTIYEIVQFNSVSDIDLPTTAGNRGEGVLQTPTALYYEQQVYFGDGPGENTLVHTENGSWLNLTVSDPHYGEDPYQGTTNTRQQTDAWTIAKMMSVPHGNSILALGTFEPPTATPSSGVPIKGRPDPFPVLPTPVPPTTAELDTTAYSTKLVADGKYQNPRPDWALDPFIPLQQGAALINPTHYMAFNVTTLHLPNAPAGVQGGVVNIPFEAQHANVQDYGALYWLMSTDGGHTYPYLAYAQAMTLKLEIKPNEYYLFPHVTTNLITRQGT